MSTSSSDFQALLHSDQVVQPPEAVRRKALVQNYEELYERSLRDTEKFWAEIAGELEWFQPWDKVLEWDYPYFKWFTGAQCNITVNCLDRHVRKGFGDKRAWIWIGEDGEERVFSYAEVLRLVCRIANGLKSIGVGRGDRVCIYLPLTPEGMATMLACARIGAVHSVVYAGLGAGALRDRIQDAEAKVVVTADVGYRRGREVPLKPIVDEAIAQLPAVEKVVVWRRQGDATRLAGDREVDFDRVIASQSDECAPEVMDSEDRLFILYTSGTTGKPKGPVYVHGGYAVGTYYLCKIAYDLQHDDIYWCTSDIGWIVGHSSMVYGPLANGTTCVIREGAPDYPDPGVVWSIVEKYRVTQVFTAPTALRMFMRFGEEYPNRYDLKSLRILICAGEPLNPEAWVWTKRHILGDHGMIVDNWWQTETGAPTIGTLPVYPGKPGKAGKPFPGIRAEVVDPRTGTPVGPNQGGALILRGCFPQQMRTIWRAPERYEEYWREIEGAYLAGDVATYDEDGYITVLGRSDDVLNVAGHRIGTADVESALVSHPAVGEAAVIGKPDPIKGESIKAFVILRAGNQPSGELQQVLVEHVRRELGPIASPGELEFVPKLPKTRSGKIMRRLLKAQELGLDPGDVTTLED